MSEATHLSILILVRQLKEHILNNLPFFWRKRLLLNRGEDDRLELIEV